MQRLEKLIKGLDTVEENDIVLLCFPFAGGSASAFNYWNKKLSKKLRVCPIQLPGREERITEKPYREMEKLVEDIIQAIHPYPNTLVLFGHSMGAKIAFEVEKRLEKTGRKAAVLFVSGSRAPHIPEPHPIYQLSDEEFERELARFEGTPKEILENKELLGFFRPMLRADFTMDESYYSKDIILLNCPIIAFGGKEDKEANQEEILSWRMYTQSYFQYRIFPGGHFFIREKENQVLSEINKNVEFLYKKSGLIIKN